jgi:hypothetical protein
MVRVPVTAAGWSTWKRYCRVAGVSMGRAIAVLIDRELSAVVGAAAGKHERALEQRAAMRLAGQEAELASRTRELDATEKRLRGWSEHLRAREEDLEVREWHVEALQKLSSQRQATRAWAEYGPGGVCQLSRTRSLNGPVKLSAPESLQ